MLIEFMNAGLIMRSEEGETWTDIPLTSLLMMPATVADPRGCPLQMLAS